MALAPVNIDAASSNIQEIEAGNVSILSPNTRDDAMSIAAGAGPCQSGIAADKRVLPMNNEPILRRENKHLVPESLPLPTDDKDKCLNGNVTMNRAQRDDNSVVSEIPRFDVDAENDNTIANGEFVDRGLIGIHRLRFP